MSIAKSSKNDRNIEEWQKHCNTYCKSIKVIQYEKYSVIEINFSDSTIVI